MVSQEYVVLRSEIADFSDEYLSIPTTGSDEDPGSPPQLTVAVEQLGKPDLANMQRDPNVLNIAPRMPMCLVSPKASFETDIPTTEGATWGVKAVGALNAEYSGAGITVAVLDTGIDEDHEAFSGLDLIQRDFTGEGNGDGNGHGTHCAGTMFGQTVNGFRFGVAPGVEDVLIAKVLDGNGKGSSEQIYDAIVWALGEGANIISMSIAMDFPGYVTRLVDQDFPVALATSRALEAYRANVRLFDKLSEIARARSAFGHSTILLAAAGNESKRDVDPTYEITVAPPAAADGIVAVGALEKIENADESLRVADFSNTGPSVAAPGVDIFSAKAHGGYVRLSGTSMATPHAAGVAALWGEKILAESETLDTEAWVARLTGRACFLPHLESLDIGAGLVRAP